MTLAEYLNQQDPVKMPMVILAQNEYHQGNFIGIPGFKIASVTIPEIGYTYCVKEYNKRLYTTDEDGNPKSPSCFYIP